MSLLLYAIGEKVGHLVSPNWPNGVLEKAQAASGVHFREETSLSIGIIYASGSLYGRNRESARGVKGKDAFDK